MNNITPDGRLMTAASYVRQGAYFADIGTDHAYLPVFLIESGRISRALACDIAKGPCDSARRTVSNAGLSDKIEIIMTDGLLGLENKGIEDIAICGMGGELIVSIIDRAPFVFNTAVRLILIPMSKPEYLRLYLAKRGFAVLSETLSCVCGKIYSAICAEYSGEPYQITAAGALLGEYNITHPTKLLYQIAQHKYDVLLRSIEGKRSAGLDTDIDTLLARELEEIINDGKRTV